MPFRSSRSTSAGGTGCTAAMKSSSWRRWHHLLRRPCTGPRPRIKRAYRRRCRVNSPAGTTEKNVALTECCTGCSPWCSPWRAVAGSPRGGIVIARAVAPALHRGDRCDSCERDDFGPAHHQLTMNKKTAVGTAHTAAPVFPNFGEEDVLRMVWITGVTRTQKSRCLSRQRGTGPVPNKNYGFKAV